jgi:NAD(P)-dependent dehydrogenase (short-subunit alcohol dehydrogenase family)
MGVMIVTGGGRGIGAAIAEGAGRKGWDVAVNYRKEKARAEAVADGIRKSGRKAIAVQADVAQEADILRLFETVDRELGTVGALVNNAGIDIENFLADVRLADIEQIFRVNVYGPMLCAREAVRRMSTAKGGKGGAIVNIGSVAGRTGGMKKGGAYAASKAAVDTFTRALALETAQQGVRVTCVRPGLTDTEMFGDANQRAEAREYARTGAPMGRMGRADEIAGLALWLCSDEATYVTGFSYDVSGGR